MNRLYSVPIVLTGLLLGFSAASVGAAATLTEALDRAWERAVPARLTEAQRATAEASRTVADSLFPDAPSIGIAQRDDRFNRHRGVRERELELALPLWLPGQREARRMLAEREETDSDAAAVAARLALAGELRTAVWALTGARAEMEIARERVQLAERLEAEAARREAAGDLSRTDLLLAQEELLAAQAARAEMGSRERQALARYRLLTGSDVLPVRIEEEIRAPAGLPHPRLRLAEASAERARAEMQLARASRRDAPELAIGWQQSREDFAARENNSVRFGIRIPFATEVRNAPRIAAANGSLIRAEAEYRQALAELEMEQREATAQLDNAQLAMDAAAQRATLAGERLRHLERAFGLGELSLGELVRVRSGANEARLEATRTRLAHAAARARLNQAQGILP